MKRGFPSGGTFTILRCSVRPSPVITIASLARPSPRPYVRKVFWKPPRNQIFLPKGTYYALKKEFFFLKKYTIFFTAFQTIYFLHFCIIFRESKLFLHPCLYKFTLKNSDSPSDLEKTLPCDPLWNRNRFSIVLILTIHLTSLMNEPFTRPFTTLLLLCVYSLLLSDRLNFTLKKSKVGPNHSTLLNTATS